MTAQFSDTVAYRGKDYAIAGLSGSALFDPRDHGLEPVARCTACWRGFLCSYLVDHQQLLLTHLAVCLEDPAPALFGVEPKADTGQTALFDAIYEDVGYALPYTGGLLLGRGFIEQLYVHMGFHPAWKYRKVHELIFEAGNLVGATDRSEEIAGFRKEVADRPLRPGMEAEPAEIKRWIEQCFSQRYKW